MANTKKYDLRDYSQLIKDCVAELSKKDTEYYWHVKLVGEFRAQIFWSYLAAESNDSFTLNLKPCHPVTDEWFITCNDPQGLMINGEIIVDEPKTRWDCNLPMAIQMLISAIGRHAHTYY